MDIANAMVSDGAESPTQACFVPKLRLPDLVNKTIGYVTEFEFQMNNLVGGNQCISCHIWHPFTLKKSLSEIQIELCVLNGTPNFLG